MAVARPQPGGGSTGLKVALVVLICVTLASLTFAIIIYTNYEDMNNDLKSYESQAKRADQQRRELQQQHRDLAMIIIGEQTDEPADIKQKINTKVSDILGDRRLQEANIASDSAVLTVLQELHKQFSENADILADLTGERNDLSNQMKQLNESMTTIQKDFADQTQKFQNLLDELGRKNEQNHEQWNQQVAKLRLDLDDQTKTAAQTLESLREDARKMEKDLQDMETQNKELSSTLAAYQPSVNRLAALQIADGHILKVAAGADVVYIDLGKQHGLKRKMTFAVYSTYEPIPESGKGKASIEVVRAFESTSECKVTTTKLGNPIVVGDVVSNPVFDRNRQFNFIVAGDFDLDFDDEIEDPDGNKVRLMIKQWGGKIVNGVDTRTDIVVLGAAPPLAAQLPEGASDEALERNAERAKAREAFDALVEKAQALSIPILTRTQFLHFIGFVMPDHVKDDRPVS